MVIKLKDGIYVAESNMDDRFALKDAGFTWTRIVAYKWATKSPEIASRLVRYCDESCRSKLQEIHEGRKQNIEASRAASADIEIPVPEGLEYLPFQRAGIAYASQRACTLIGDEMGLGKTIQVIGMINADETIKRVLVICPASLKLNWRKELWKWLVRPLRVMIADGIFPPEEIADIVIINYDVLKKHRAQIRSRKWDVICLDESHYAKNPKAQRTKEIVGDGKWNKSTREMEYTVRPLDARRKLALTGTPILNRPIEIQPVVGWLCPEEFGSFWKFAMRYCNAHQGGFGWDLSGSSHLDELQEKLRSTIMVRRLKADVLTELPAKRRQVLEIPANGAQGIVDKESTAYGRHQEEIDELRVMVELSKVSENPDDYKNAVAKLSECTRVAFTEISKLRHEVALAKVPAVIEHSIETLENVGKLLIFAHHHDVIAGLMEGLKDFSPVKLTGEMSQGERQASVDNFQTDNDCRVFIGSIHAAGVGLTLTASSTVVFAELDWVPANLTQAEDRTHRIGQKESVLVQHIVIDGSLDARMAKAIVDKQEVADKALDRETEVIPVTIGEVKGVSVTRKQIEEEYQEITPEEVFEIHAKLRLLSTWCDGARTRDASGFNKFDAGIGKSLAQQERLTNRQAVLGKKLVRKYRRQLETVNA